MARTNSVAAMETVCPDMANAMATVTVPTTPMRRSAPIQLRDVAAFPLNIVATMDNASAYWLAAMATRIAPTAPMKDTAVSIPVRLIY